MKSVLTSRAGISSFSLLDGFITSVSLSTEEQAGALTILDYYFMASVFYIHPLEEVFDLIWNSGVWCSMQGSHFPCILFLLSSCKLETVKLTKTEYFEADAEMCYMRPSCHNFIFNVIYDLAVEEKSLLIFWNSIWSYFSKIMFLRANYLTVFC